MNIPDCAVVLVDVRNIPAAMPECILSNINCSNELQFSSCATFSMDIIKIILLLS